MKHIKYLFLVLIMLVVFILLVQNHEAFNTKVVLKANILLGQYETPELSIYLISTISFLLGVIIIWVYDLLERIQLRKQIKRLNNESKEKDKELNSLRNLPIISENVTPGVHENDIELT
ncbi:MAG: LapA family protein [Desulfobacteraceae bacterium]